MLEIWLPIVGLEDCGEVSNYGRIRSLNKKQRKTFVSYNGYERVGMRGGKITLTVHQLVAEAFCGGKIGGKQINHIDGNKLNNLSTNLEWVTASENIRHALDSGLRARKTTKEILPSSAIPDIIKRIKLGEKQSSLAHEYGVKSSSLCCRIKRYKEAQLCL